jgi:hypothetical protein
VLNIASAQNPIIGRQASSTAERLRPFEFGGGTPDHFRRVDKAQR